MKKILILSIAFLLGVTSVWAHEATFYSDNLDKGGTANGDTYMHNVFSAAICEMELGQFAHVQYGGTGIVVELNDRPNCRKYPNVIDLSQSAFAKLDAPSRGRIYNVNVTPIGKVPKNTQKTFISSDVFSSLGIRLDDETPNIYFAGEGIRLSGKVLDGKTSVLYFLENNETHESLKGLGSVNIGGVFSVHFTLPKTPGNYSLIIASGQSFETSLSTPIQVLDKNSLTYPQLQQDSFGVRPRIADLSQGVPGIYLPSGIWGELSLFQGSNHYDAFGNTLLFENSGLSVGTGSANIRAYGLSTSSSLDRNKDYGTIFSGNVYLDEVKDTINPVNAKIRIIKNNANITFVVPPTEAVRPEYYVTFPSGEVREYKFPQSVINTDGYLIPRKRIAVKLPLPEEGTYTIEAVRESGLALFNIPIVFGNVWNIIEPLSETDRSVLRRNTSVVRDSVIARINTLRANLHTPALQVDDNLMRLAQAKADNMAENNYVGHYTPSGENIQVFANRIGITLTSPLGENVAGGNIADKALQNGLENSGSHRFNMLRSEWKKVGVGYVLSAKDTYLVQVFSE